MFQFSDTGGLFDNFEVNADPFWPKVSKIIGGSVIFHVVLIVAITLIPPVRDALSIAMIFSGGSLVDRPYNKTHIENEGDITEITNEKFHYPEGYFAMDQTAMPTPTPTPAFAAPPPFVPKPVPAAQLEPSPSPTATSSPVAVNKATPSPAASASPQTEDQKAAEKAQDDLDKASRATGIELPKEDEINKRPLKDWVAYASDLSKQNKLDLNQTFEVIIDAELDQDGKLKNPKFTKQAGDLNLTDLGGRLVAALNDSGLLIYLKKLNQDNPGTHVIFTIRQGNDQIAASVESEAASVDSARQLAAGFKVMLAIGARARKGKNEEVYLKSTTVSANEKKITFGLTLPRQTVVDLLKKEIVSASEAASPTP